MSEVHFTYGIDVHCEGADGIRVIDNYPDAIKFVINADDSLSVFILKNDVSALCANYPQGHWHHVVSQIVRASARAATTP